jgi:hypothetical protein
LIDYRYLSSEEAPLPRSDISLIMQYNVVDEKWSNMRRLILDKVDFSILATLAKDCRTSYSR